MGITLVTGGAGFIGTHLVATLLDQNAEVRVLDLHEPRISHASLSWEKGSITDAAAVASAMEGVTRVYHLAAVAGLWARDKRQLVEVNRQGTHEIMKAAASRNVERVVHCSTEAVLKSRHRFRATGATIDEDVSLDLDDMVGPYCQGKFLAEQEVLQAARNGLPVVIVNPTVPIGPGDHNLTPPARMLLGFLNGKHPGYLDTELNLVDARDVAMGHILAAEHGRVGERYTLGGTNLHLGELLAQLEGLTGLTMPRRKVPYPLALIVAAVSEFTADYITGRPPAVPLTGVRLAGSTMRFDNLKARNELGATFRPLQETLTEAVADFQRRGLLHAELALS